MMLTIMSEPDLELYQTSSMTSITVRTMTNRKALEDQHSPL
jgi:hypothetical protein